MGTRASMQLQEEEIIEIQNETGCKVLYYMIFFLFEFNILCSSIYFAPTEVVGEAHCFFFVHPSVTRSFICLLCSLPCPIIHEVCMPWIYVITVVSQKKKKSAVFKNFPHHALVW